MRYGDFQVQGIGPRGQEQLCVLGAACTITLTGYGLEDLDSKLRLLSVVTESACAPTTTSAHT